MPASSAFNRRDRRPPPSPRRRPGGMDTRSPKRHGRYRRYRHRRVRGAQGKAESTAAGNPTPAQHSPLCFEQCNRALKCSVLADGWTVRTELHKKNDL